jgi:hypothetical protein
MTSQPRVLDLLDSLKDTTVSIYFVPDIFVFDLIQARIDDVGGIPVVAVCETPFSGFNGLSNVPAILCYPSSYYCLFPLFCLQLQLG